MDLKNKQKSISFTRIFYTHYIAFVILIINATFFTQNTTSIIVQITLAFIILLHNLDDKQMVSKLESFNKKVMLKNNYIKMILDAQISLIIVTDGKKLVEMNKAGFTFLGFKSIEEFSKEHLCVCELFLEEEGFLQAEENGKVWIDVLKQQNNKLDRVKFKSLDGNIHIFKVTINLDEIILDNGQEVNVVVFTDVTKDEKTKEELTRLKQEIEDVNDHLEAQVDERIIEIVALHKDVRATQKEIIFTMGSIGESRSKETGNHVKRVAEYSKLLADYLGIDKFHSELLKEASPMHDIGKIGIADSILNKPGRHTPEETKIMQTHSALGYEMLRHSDKELLQIAAIVSHEHHEKYDGTGYPRGLKGEDINIYARITAVADVFDALGSDRVYKKAWRDEDIFKMLEDEKAKHFDPDIVDVFLNNKEDFMVIRDKFSDV